MEIITDKTCLLFEPITTTTATISDVNSKPITFMQSSLVEI